MITGDLHAAARSCHDGFAGVARMLDSDEPERLSFAELRRVWNRHYFGDFARFDQLLRQKSDARDPGWPVFLPLSISHHNLHRLFEVLHREIGDAELGATRIPERIVDLRVVVDRLSRLLGEFATRAEPVTAA